ncbi:sugar phosphate isomerase/epimerase family protein [Gordoniibacillus kamchatkensis]|uniref:sugar phosphate isomerase/epimerase family protein n=1 Tax=Gordoniibacillus kamchatkensis TaxID=1590651 RepID=UPI000AA46A43|nr:TIM barrel protein [Paenibacillus sp. VKM B-2647]
MRKNQIAAQLFTLREFAKTAEQLDETLRKVKDIGYDAVQVSGIGPIEPAKVKELADRHGLTICATHVPYERLKNDLEQVIQEHRLWGCRYVGLGSMPAPYRTGKSGYTLLADEFSAVGRALADAGLQFVYHNHKFEFEKFEGETGMDWLLRASDPEAFHFELDTYWVQAGGATRSAGSAK